MLESKGGGSMKEYRDEWHFLRARAAQLFEEGDVRGSLRLMRTLNRLQCEAFHKLMAENMNEPKIVSTQAH